MDNCLFLVMRESGRLVRMALQQGEYEATERKRWVSGELVDNPSIEPSTLRDIARLRLQLGRKKVVRG